MNIDFIKMHGLGNDFILIDCIQQSTIINSVDFQVVSKQLCHRRFGIGADQVLLLCPSDSADFQMKIHNADGSEVEMCGNGIRCLAKYIWDRNLSEKNILDIETLAGIVKPEKAGDLVRVDMGKPIFDPEKIPVNIGQELTSHLATNNPPIPPLEKGGKEGFENRMRGGIIDYPLKIDEKEFKITCVSMGNPHAVIFVDDVTNFPVTYYGPMVENHSLFPKKTNVEFIEVLSSNTIKMRVWERGAGETMACGTGASAAAVASNIKGFANKKVTVQLLGGDLIVDWAADNHVYMTGPAVEVYQGRIQI
jgi:diaminopimelate epimerase